uniref:Uncharacterized protein n=1 Tax=Arundo donax TaxID=35708 RepID=A0A0A9EJN0_ARUDO
MHSPVRSPAALACARRSPTSLSTAMASLGTSLATCTVCRS